jgi:hypothetical protein
MREFELGVQSKEPREWEYNGVQRSTRLELVGNSYGNFLVKEN